mmetsp:Transcript_21115/g.66872  ORF Transcript_21115/g.66872 Transcript_21115/m.66872 type:complete len:101 (+) Transcript_21115:84-386(+)
MLRKARLHQLPQFARAFHAPALQLAVPEEEDMDGAATQPLIRGGDDDSKAPVRWQPIVKSSLFGSDTFDNPFPEVRPLLPNASQEVEALPRGLLHYYRMQ